MKKFEYDVVEVAGPLVNLPKQLNVLGDEGWELITILPGTSKSFLLLKREK